MGANPTARTIESRPHSAFPLAQRALAACWAIAFRASGDSRAALALPPLEPPSFPNATAAGFFTLTGVGRVSNLVTLLVNSSAACWTAMLGRLGTRAIVPQSQSASHPSAQAQRATILGTSTCGSLAMAP